MRIELDKLEGDADSFSYIYEPGELSLDEENARLTEPPSVQGRLKRSGHEVRLRGSISAEAEVDCDRCLKPIAVPVRTEFEVTYVPAADYRAAETAELQEEDLSVSVFDEETIDIDELVREQILLALPLRALCTEDCQGLCPVCGTNRNVQPCACQTAERDPRWDALKNL
ncbi:MAG TPA: DUF177 domain-containing protein [Pyrinomonadaceae bacterium]|jgi:uncharacterized protein